MFWDTVVNCHTYVTGGNSEWEHFGMDHILDKERTNCNNETCNIYNMMKLSRELFMITGDVKYMNYYENAYYNSILSSQNPETGMTTYFQPMASGYFKVYSTPFTNFWCCTGTGFENMTNQSVIASNVAVGSGTTVKGTVKVTDGKLTINAKTNDKAINFTYILIYFGQLDPLKVEADTTLINSDPTPSVPTEDPTQPETPVNPGTATGLTVETSINSWGSGYQIGFKIVNDGEKVDTWTLKVKASEIKIDSSWNGGLAFLCHIKFFYK